MDNNHAALESNRGRPRQRRLSDSVVFLTEVEERVEQIFEDITFDVYLTTQLCLYISYAVTIGFILKGGDQCLGLFGHSVINFSFFFTLDESQQYNAVYDDDYYTDLQYDNYKVRDDDYYDDVYYYDSRPLDDDNSKYNSTDYCNVGPFSNYTVDDYYYIIFETG